MDRLIVRYGIDEDMFWRLNDGCTISGRQDGIARCYIQQLQDTITSADTFIATLRRRVKQMESMCTDKDKLIAKLEAAESLNPKEG